MRLYVVQKIRKAAVTVNEEKCVHNIISLGFLRIKRLYPFNSFTIWCFLSLSKIDKNMYRKSKYNCPGLVIN